MAEQEYNIGALDRMLNAPGDVTNLNVAPPVNFNLPEHSPSGVNFPSFNTGKKLQAEDPVTSALGNLFNSGTSARTISAGVNYNDAEVNSARYLASPDFLKLGISPYGDNEEIYGQNQSWSEVLSNGFSGMKKLASNGFVDGWKGWGRLTDALVHWDWSKLQGDAESMMELDESMKEIMNLNPIYATKEGTDTFWNRQTFGNFLQQSGFAIGAFGQMAAEQGITKLIEMGLAATGVGAVGAVALEGVADAKLASNLNRMRQFFNVAQHFKAMKKLGDIWKSEGVMKNFLTSFGQSLPGVDIGMDMYKAFETGKNAGLSGTKLAGDLTRIGAFGVKRLMSEANFAFTEARMEAAGTFTDLYNQLQEDHFDQYGEYATGDKLQAMQDTSLKAADKNFSFNSSILYLSNRIQFDNLFKNSKALSSIMTRYGDDVAEDVFKIKGKFNNRSTVQYYKGNVFSNYGAIKETFGKTTANLAVGKSIMKNLLQFETTEGVQELLQEGSNVYYQDLYKQKYNAKYNGGPQVNEDVSFDKAVASQVNMQGLKTFMSGALTGMMIQGPMLLAQYGAKKGNRFVTDKYKTKDMTDEQKKEYFEKRDEKDNKQKEYYNEFNAIARDPSKVLSESIGNLNIQGEISKGLEEAVKAKDKFAYENIRTDALHSIIVQSIRNNTYEGLIDTLKEYGDNMTKDEFEKAFVGLEYTSRNKKTAKSYTDKVVTAIDSYKVMRDKLQEKYSGIANPNKFRPGSKEQMQELFKQKTLDDMIDIIAGNEYKAKNTLDRATELYDKYSQHRVYGSSFAHVFSVMGSEVNSKGEINVLKTDIKTRKDALKNAEGLSETERNKLNKEIETKEKEIQHLTNWIENKDELIDDRKVDASYRGFIDYFHIKNKQVGNHTKLTRNEAEESFLEFMDYVKLNQKAQDHVNAINMLTNPDYFKRIHQRMIEGAQQAYFQIIGEAGIEHIKEKDFDGKHFIINISGSFVLYDPSGQLVAIYQTADEARKEKEKLDKTLLTEDEMKALLKSSEVPPAAETKGPEEKKTNEPEKKEAENKPPVKAPIVKLMINGRVAIILTKFTTASGEMGFSYAFEDKTDEINEAYADPKTKTYIDSVTKETIIVAKIPEKEEVENPQVTVVKSIEDQIKDLEDQIEKLPNKGMVVENNVMSASPELQAIKKKIDALKQQLQKESEAAKLKVAEVKEKLKSLNDKKFKVDPNDSNFYIDEEGNRYSRVSNLKEPFTGGKTDAAERGTIIDDLLRAFIADEIKTLDDLKKAYNSNKLKPNVAEFTPKFLTELFDIFNTVKKVTKDKNLELISDIPTLWGELNGDNYAGTIDLLGIDKDGNVFIIDLKTSSQNRRDASGAYYKKYKDGDSIQQSAYAELLRQRTGITVKGIAIFPIQVNKKDGNYDSAIANKDEKGQFTMPVVIDRTLFPVKEEEKEIKEVISDDIYNNFIDKNIVPQDILESIADKTINNTPLSEREKAIFTGKTSDINNIIIIKANNNSTDIEKRIQDLKKKFDDLNDEINKIFNDEKEEKQKLIEKFLKKYNVILPKNIRIYSWSAQELINKEWKTFEVDTKGGAEAFFGKENWDNIKKAKKDFDVEFEKLEESNVSKTDLLEQKQRDLLSTKDGLELRKAWSLGIIEEDTIVGLDSDNFVEKEFELIDGNYVDKDTYIGYYYLPNTEVGDEWTESITGTSKQEVIDKINAKYDAELAALENSNNNSTESEKEQMFPIGSIHKGVESGNILKVVGYTKDGVRFEIQKEGAIKPTQNLLFSELKRLINENKLLLNIEKDEDVITNDDVDQDNGADKDTNDNDSKESEKAFQVGIRQTAPALSLANRTHAVNVVEIRPGVERYERGAVNNTYIFDVATPDFFIGKPLTFKVIDFNDDYDKANIGIYYNYNGKEVLIGSVHTPQWIEETKGPRVYPHIVIPDVELNDPYPATLKREVDANRNFRKLVLDNHKQNTNFVLNGSVMDKSNGILVSVNNEGLLIDRLNKKIAEGGTNNRHGMFAIVRKGFLQVGKGITLDASKIAETNTFSDQNISNLDGYAVMMLPTPTGTFFPTFIKLPRVKREQSEFIIKAVRVFKGLDVDQDFVNKVYNAVGATYVSGSTPNMQILRKYIDHYITHLNNTSLSKSNGSDVNDNTSRIDIFDDGHIRLQSKLNGVYSNTIIRDLNDLPSDLYERMDNLLTTVRFTDPVEDALIGINSTQNFTLLGLKNGKLVSQDMKYNEYIMRGAKTYVDKGVESKNKNGDWVYFANPVVKFDYTEPSKPDTFSETMNKSKTDVDTTSVNIDDAEDDAEKMLAYLRLRNASNKSVEEKKENCTGSKPSYKDLI